MVHLAVRARRNTPMVKVGGVKIGGHHPVVIQSMTNTPTQDVEATVAQVKQLADAGSELVRLTVEHEPMAKAVPLIKKRLLDEGYDTPIVGDFHYNGHYLLEKYPACTKALDKLRINPGNCGFGERRDANFEAFIKVAKEYGKPVRIGVNMGSLDQGVLARMMDDNSRRTHPLPAEQVALDAAVFSAVQSTNLAKGLGLADDLIVVSAKVSEVQSLLYINRKLAQELDAPLHIGLTEAGMGVKGIVAATQGIGVLLNEGIGDTIRVSITPEPGAPRTEEVRVCREILQTHGIRAFTPMTTSCPGCGRTTSTAFQELTQEVNAYLEEQVPAWKKKGYAGVEQMRVAVMGCIVNGPGESKGAHIGISLPGSGENPRAPVYVDGRQVAVLEGAGMKERFKEMVARYVEDHYAPQMAAL